MWLELQIFGFRALWSPYFFLFLFLVSIVYYLITGPYRKRFGNFLKPTILQQIAFYSSIILLYIVKGSPVDLLSHIMLTAHMTQMAVFLIIVPILMIIGIPEWIWIKILEAPVIGNITKVFTKPLISMVVFNGLFSVYHIPIVFDYSKTSPIAHFTIHFILIVAAFLMWLPVLNPVKKYDKLRPLLKVAYIFGNSVLITPACALIIFSSTPLYAAYTSEGAWLTALSLCVPTEVLSGLSTYLSGPEMFSPLSLLIDQQLGGIIMKVLQEIVYGAVLISVLSSWFKEDKSNVIDPLPNSLK